MYRHYGKGRRGNSFLFPLIGFVFQVQFARQRRVDERRLLLVVELWPARAGLVLHTDHLVKIIGRITNRSLKIQRSLRKYPRSLS